MSNQTVAPGKSVPQKLNPFSPKERRLFPRYSSDVAKGIAILLMLFYHLFSVGTDNEIMKVIYAPLPEDLFLTLAGFGNICVAVFVFLTSYGISVKLFVKENLSLKEAYLGSIRRAGRLYFNFFLVFAVSNLLWFKHFDYALCYGPGKQGFLAFLADALCLSQFFGTPTLNMTWWYMALAFTLIFLVPGLAVICKKTGIAFLGIAFLMPFILNMGNDLSRYFFVMALGITVSYTNWIEKILNSKIPFLLRGIVELGLIIFSVFARENEFVQSNYLYLADGLIAFIIVLFAADVLAAVPVLRTVLAFLGHHSMNMFFVHTFFYLILYRNYVFYFRYAGVTFLILIAVSLLYSLLLEGIKKLLCFLWGKIIQKPQAQKDRA